MDVRALYVEAVSKTKITLTVSGTAEQPILVLSSDPPMEQTDIISVIVTGKPMDDLGKSGGNNNQALAKEVVANYFAEQLRALKTARVLANCKRLNTVILGRQSNDAGD